MFGLLSPVTTHPNWPNVCIPNFKQVYNYPSKQSKLKSMANEVLIFSPEATHKEQHASLTPSNKPI